MKKFAYDFEEQLFLVEQEIKELEQKGERTEDEDARLEQLKRALPGLVKKTYGSLTAWQRVQLARHPHRPKGSDFIENIFSDFARISGDRRFKDDRAVVCGIGWLEGKKFAVAAVDKGKNSKEKMEKNFGMPLPEGYYKFIRLIRLAESLKIPLITFVDTPGAYPGLEAEERGQAWAIANAIRTMVFARIPTMSFLIGEGGSGGALALSVADRLYAFENAYFSVISPEGCASILFHDEKRAPEAAEKLRLTAHDLFKLGIIHGVLKEENGALHRNPAHGYTAVKKTIEKELPGLEKMSPDERLEHRLEFFKKAGNNESAFLIK